MPDGRRLVLADDLAAAVALAEARFRDVADRLHRLLPEARIDHVGATAIPGCLTKGDLDIAVRVTAAAFEDARAVLGGLFPDNPGSVRTATFAAFAEEEAVPPLGVQCVAIGSELDVFTRFRDRMRASPSLVEAYNALKRRHAGRDMDGYRNAKATFIANVLRGDA